MQGDAGLLARLMGTSCDGQRPLRLNDFVPDAAGLYTIAVAHAQPDLAMLENRGINYWALGGRHDRGTPQSGAQFVHYCGTTQGRRPEESGIHGCTLVEVDGQRQTRTSLISTDVVRWMNERLVVDAATFAEELQSRLRERVEALMEASPDVTMLISWTSLVADH